MNRYEQVTDEGQTALATTRLAMFIIEELERDIRQRGAGFLILPGGSSPRVLISELARLKKDWRNITVTTTDERCVPLENEYSNAGQIKRLTGIDSFCLWEGDRPASVDDLPWPATVCVLGMGLDGHIASLFTKEDMADATKRLIRTTAPVEPFLRVSLTMKSLLDSRNLVLLVTGAKKKALYEAVSRGNEQGAPIALFVKAAGDRLSPHVTES